MREAPDAFANVKVPLVLTGYGTCIRRELCDRLHMVPMLGLRLRP
jgi:hypothetical protein